MIIDTFLGLSSDIENKKLVNFKFCNKMQTQGIMLFSS
jgi:hypothetical protein